VTIRLVCLFTFILLSSFLLFILSSFFSLFILIIFMCRFLHFIVFLLHIYHLPFITFTFSQLVFVSYLFSIRLDTDLFSGVKSDIFPELSNHVEPVDTLPLRTQAVTKPLKTSAHYDEHNRTETSRNFGW
jgi:hypothetical protein